MKFLCSAGMLLAASFPAVSAAATFADADVGDRVSVEPFTFASGKTFSERLHFKRIDVYAPSARILVASAEGWREAPRSAAKVFVTDATLTASRAYLVVEPDGRRFSGGVLGSDGDYRIVGTLEKGAALTVMESKRVGEGTEPFQCGGSTVPQHPDGLVAQPALNAASLASAKGSATHAAVVAVDTDNEFMGLRFADNVTTATAYLVNLFAGLNVIYERDLAVQLQQGDVLLRVSSVADPYSAPGTSTSAQLQEFSEHWRVNQQSRQRAFAMLLSGKSPSDCGIGGVAWVLNGEFGSFTALQQPPDGFEDRNYCNAKGARLSGGTQTFGHFSVSQVFKGACGSGSDASNDLSLIGHELGHNFGAQHTHCTASNGSNPFNSVATGTIDTCYNGEAGSGCYSGPVSCPNEAPLFVGQGSLMSYCNFGPPNGANCGQDVVQRFHPTHEAFLDTRVATNVANGCFTALASNVGPTLTPTPANNSTTNLSGGVVGANVTGSIAFAVSGGSGNGTTSLVCTGTGAVTVTAGSPQNSIAVGGAAANVTARITLTASTQQGSVQCTATPQGGSAVNFTFNFTAPAGTQPVACTSPCILRSGFEAGED